MASGGRQRGAVRVRWAVRRLVLPVAAALVAATSPSGRPRKHKTVPERFDLGSDLEVEVYRRATSRHRREVAAWAKVARPRR